MSNACQSCGACCALYRVALKCSETDDQLGGVVPLDLTVPYGKDKRLMKGTEKFMKRCQALVGNVGRKVACRIYDQRPSACRDFAASWEGISDGNPLCDRARIIHGLVPFNNVQGLW